MQKKQYTIAILQETRLRLPPDCQLATHHIHHTPAIKGRGGLVTLIDKQPHVKLIHSQQISPRIQITTIKINQRMVHIINAHAPTARDTPQAHHSFQQALIAATAPIPDGQIILGGIDLNCKLKDKCLEFSCVGPYATSSRTASHVDQLLEHWQQKRLMLMNTFVAPYDEMQTPAHHEDPNIIHHIGTWKEHKSNGHHVHQIDFILTSENIATTTTFCQPLPWQEFTSLHTSDHRPVAIHFTIAHDSSHHNFNRPQRRHKRFLNPEHKEKCKKMVDRLIRKLEKQWPPESTPPHLQLFQRQNIIQHCIHKSAPRNTLVPKKPWLQDTTLAALFDLTQLRKTKALWHQLFREPPVEENVRQMLVNLHTATGGELIDVYDPIATTTALANAIKEKVYITRQMLKQNKLDWMDAKCKEINDNLNTKDVWHAYQSVRALSTTRRQLRAQRLQLDDGSVTTDPKTIDSIWMDHWATHFQATTSTINSFHNDNLPAHHCQPFNIEPLFTEHGVIDSIRRFRPRRASPNPLHSDMWREFPEVLAPALTTAANTALKYGSIPNSWAGAVTVPVHKRHASALHTTGYRPIQLLTLERKLVGRALLDLLHCHLKQNWSQFCLAKAGGIDFPIFTLNQLTQHSINNKLSTGTLYIDIASAYDSIIRQYIIPPSTAHSPLLISTLTHLGIDPTTAESTINYIHQHPASLLNLHLPPCILSILRSWIHGPWLMTPYTHYNNTNTFPTSTSNSDDHTFSPPPSVHNCPPQPSLITSTGILQGDPVSTALFATSFQITIDHVIHNLQMRDPQYSNLFHSLQQPATRCLNNSPPGTATTIVVTHIAFADDLVWPMANKCPARLLQGVILVMEQVVKSFQAFGLKVNMKQGKTELALRMLTKHAKGLWQSLHYHHINNIPISSTTTTPPLTDTSSIPRDRKQLSIHLENGTSLTVTASYLYLGKHQTPHLSQHKEIATRVACTTTAFNNVAKPLTSPQVDLGKRLQLMKTLTHVHLRQQHHTTPHLEMKHFNKLNRSYITTIKRILNLPKLMPSSWQTTPERQVLAITGERPLEDVLRGQRLLFLQRLLVSHNPIIQAAMFISGPRTFWATWFADLAVLREKVDRLQQLPEPSLQTRETWCHYIILANNEWRSTIRRHLQQHHKTPVRSMRTVPPHLFTDVYHHDDYATPDMPLAEEEELQPEHPDLHAPQRLQGEQEQVNSPFTCEECHKDFTTYRGLALHRRRVHEIIPPLALRIRGDNVCIVCGSQLNSRVHLMEHLSKRAECGLGVLHRVPAMPIEEYKANISTWAKASTLYTRSSIPRTGPIPHIEGLPRSQAVLAVHPLEILYHGCQHGHQDSTYDD
eukprot:6490447-Amphidinium_carterae.2